MRMHFLSLRSTSMQLPMRLPMEIILPDRDYGFQMRFVKGDVATFFRPRERAAAGGSTRLTERRRWIESDPATCVALLPEGEDLLGETLELAVSLRTLPDDGDAARFDGLTPAAQCRALGEFWEPDFLLLRPDGNGIVRLVGGCLCFPSHWDLREKLGRSMAAIHGVVPGLNEALGTPIDKFLRRIKPGVSWERYNWGLSRTPELNLHPSRDLPRLDATVALDEVWWRLEEQSLVALPDSGGVLFGIRLVIQPLREILADPAARRGVIRAVETMPEPMARYKGIAPARARLLALMESEPAR